MDYSNLKGWFEYHPPTTPERIAHHAAINESALAFAQTIVEHVKDPDCLKFAMFAIQQARMFANQGATIDELKETSTL